MVKNRLQVFSRGIRTSKRDISKSENIFRRVEVFNRFGMFPEIKSGVVLLLQDPSLFEARPQHGVTGVIREGVQQFQGSPQQCFTRFA